MKFRSKVIEVEAVQLTWSTWSDICKLTAGISCEGCYVGEDGTVTTDTNGRIGLKIHCPPNKTSPLGVYVLAVEGDWIVREGDLIYPLSDETFRKKYEAAT